MKIIPITTSSVIIDCENFGERFGRIEVISRPQESCIEIYANADTVKEIISIKNNIKIYFKKER